MSNSKQEGINGGVQVFPSEIRETAAGLKRVNELYAKHFKVIKPAGKVVISGFSQAILNNRG